MQPARVGRAIAGFGHPGSVEDENRRLKKTFAEFGMQNELLKEAPGNM